MKYKEFRTVGSITYSKEIEGTLEEVLEVIRGVNESREENENNESSTNER
ncbi:hypothetical protein [Sporosarcina sp. FSL K6-1508]